MSGKGTDETPSRRKKKRDVLRGAFGRFEILEVVGHGGMGIVYRGRHKTMENILALKVLHPEYSRNPRFIERFISEARASGRLSHPNVVRGIDAGEWEGKHFFAMEFIDGPPLDRVLATGGRLTERRALGIALDISRALVHAWKNSVVHRDVKPGNILICSDGTAKLTDLGLAVRLDTESGKPGVTMGTPDYISPEQIEGFSDIDIRTDIYSLGVTLFQMIAGKPPYEGSAEDVMQKHLGAPFPDLQALVPDVSVPTMRVLKKMTEKDRADRYQDPAHLQKDLESALAGRGVAVDQAARALASRRLQRKTGLNLWIAVLIGSLLLFAGLVVLSFLGRNGGDDGDRRTRDVKPDGGRKQDLVDRMEEAFRKGEEALEEARAFARENPHSYEEALGRFRALMRDQGQDWAEPCLREIEAVKKAREDEAGSLAEPVLKAGKQALGSRRFADSRKAVKAFLGERERIFRKTRAFGKVEALGREIEERASSVVARLEKDLRLKLADADFVGARADADRIREADPDRYGVKALELRREIDGKERIHLDLASETLGLERLQREREKAIPLVREWKHMEAQEIFLAIRAEEKSEQVRRAAAWELRDLDRLSDFLKALGEARGAVGKELTIGGKTGKVVDVSRGYVYLEIGRFRTAFRLQNLSVEETVRLAENGLSLDEKTLRWGFGVYLYYAGKKDSARELLLALDMGENERKYYEEKLGG